MTRKSEIMHRSNRKNKDKKWHTLKWYKKQFGIDPLKLNIPYKEVKNPHYSSAAPMRLWEEKDVQPFKSEDGARLHAKRREAGIKAHQTRKKRLIEWFKKVKTENKIVSEITKRLWEIGERIRELHDLKADCREGDDNNDYWETGIDHCNRCFKWSKEQDALRLEREHLFEELEVNYGKDKKTIQLARKYCREKNQ